MPAREIPDITTYLANEEIQRRIRQNIQRIRREAMVSIGEAARLLGFSESQLRDWEKLGLLRPVRPVEETSDTRSVKKQRQYSFDELDKLVIIHELINHARLTPGLIPLNIDQIWRRVVSREEPQGSQQASSQPQTSGQEQKRYIVQRVEADYREFFWRHYASRALLLSLMLLFEDAPNTYAGLLLPSKKLDEDFEPNPYNLAQVGEALVGWLGQTRSFYTFLTPQAEFEFPSDYHMHAVKGLKSAAQEEDEIESFLIVVPRGKVANLGLEETNVRLVQRLLSPLYEDKQQWSRYFGGGARDLVYPGMDFSSKVSDAVLGGLADMVIRLGGEARPGEIRWQYSCILVAEETKVSLYQRKLIVRATSRQAREISGMALNPTEYYAANLALRAFLSSRIVLRSEIVPSDPSLVFSQLKERVRSHIAMPIGGEAGTPVGVLYVASVLSEAFSEEDQRLLRLMARMIEEVLRLYNTRQQMTADLPSLIKAPQVVDTSFKEMLSENDFMKDLETFLQRFQRASFMEGSPGREHAIELSPGGRTPAISFITVEVDNQELIALKYGNRALQSLSKAVGLRIRSQLPALIARYTDCELYYIMTGRFYLFLHGFSLEETVGYAKRLHIALSEDILLTQTDLIGGALKLPITVHMGVNWYPYDKLKEMVVPAKEQSILSASSLLYQSLDSVLKLGADREGNVIFAWNSETRTYNPLS